MDYIILMASNAMELSQVVNDFFKTDQNYNKFKLVGGPYSDSTNHYQAVIKNNQQQLNG
jgi:hypothetical protein